RGGVRRKDFASDLAGKLDVLAQRRLRLDDGTYCAGNSFGRTRDQRIACGDRCHGEVERGFRSVATADVEDNAPDAPADGNFRPHAVGPEAVDLALFQRLGGGQPEVDGRADRARDRRDAQIVTGGIDPGGDQETPQSHLHPRRGADTAALDDVD